MSQKENRRGQTGGSEREFGAAGAAILCFQNTTKNGKCQPVYSSAGRCVGRIEGGVYHKRLDPTRHKLDRPPGWAIDRDHLTVFGAWSGGARRASWSYSETEVQSRHDYTN